MTTPVFCPAQTLRSRVVPCPIPRTRPSSSRGWHRRPWNRSSRKWSRSRRATNYCRKQSPDSRRNWTSARYSVGQIGVRCVKYWSGKKLCKYIYSIGQTWVSKETWLIQWRSNTGQQSLQWGPGLNYWTIR